MSRLWAPWRIKYIRLADKEKRCVFCLTQNKSSRKHLVFKTKHSICLLNIYPYNNGHLMCSPVRHIKDLDLLSAEEGADLFKSIVLAKKLLKKTLKPDGFNIGINIGKAAGAGITGHLHIHIVPRWTGDTNFMPVVHDTKVVSQSLNELLRILRHAQKK
jgi:ATP adenylyltransferase